MGGSGGSSTGGGSPAGGTGPSAGGGGGAFSTGGGSSTAGTGYGGAGGGGYDPGVCGDGQWGGYESCDDGNTSSGDGCSSTCALEPNYACDYVGQPCQAVVCGDGLQQSYLRPDGTYAYEWCDDGNAASGDGCNASCEVEGWWICDYPGSACREPECGDGVQDSWFVPGPGGGAGGTGSSGAGGGGPSGTYHYEECDDGNAVSGDGCASACTLEAGWICSQPGSACRQPVCGDGFVDFIATGGTGGAGGSSAGGSSAAGSGGSYGGGSGGFIEGYYEGCDDGGTVAGDGCNASCAVESGWACPYWEGPCHVIVCGDGWADWPEEDCDDANDTSNDGCTDCRYDGGYGGSGSAGAPTGGFGGTG